MSFYRSPRNEIDGTREQTFWVSAAVRQDFFDRKLSVTLRIDDIFDTRRREGYTYSENIVEYSTGRRKSPNVVLAVSYKLNQNNDRNRSERNTENGGEGIEMEF